ncbi:MAG: clan AA aspartic protease [Chitinophagia bacterium]|nr:clan AA aspartic protease [Chitinophagia bacterium]
MGYVYADVELLNGDDLALERRYLLGSDEVHRMNVNILVDTGSLMLAINENIKEILQLQVVETRNIQLADSSIHNYEVVVPVEVRFKNRRFIGNAIVLPGDSEPLLGAIPLEDMDVMIHPARQELIVNPEHPDRAFLKVK